MIYTEDRLYLTICQMYGYYDDFEDLEGFKNDLHAKLTVYFIDNPQDKVIVSKSRYRRLHHDGAHTWGNDDFISDVMVANKMTKNIKWTA